MTITASELQDRWIACNNNVRISEYIIGIKEIKSSATRLLIILYRDNHAGDNTYPLGTVGNLFIFSRNRIRSPYHVTLRSVHEELRLQEKKRFSEWFWCLTPQSLSAAIEFVCSTHFIATLSTVKSGASKPLGLHFQGVPRTIRWVDHEYNLFESLLYSAEKDIISDQQGLRVSIQEYPIFVAKAVGSKKDVCEKILALALGYDHLRSFNLLVSSLKEHKVAVYFIPRRFDGQVVPTGFRENRALGSFEMAGVFLTNNEETFNQASVSELAAAISETSIQSNSPEERTIKNLLRYP